MSIRAIVPALILVGVASMAPALADGSCNRGPRQSPATRQPAQLTILNVGRAPLILDWLDFQGGHKTYATIAPGGRHVQQTYVGHVWVLSTEVGNCVKQFRAPPGASIVRAALTDEDARGGD